MIQREWQTVGLVTYEDKLDAYGQGRVKEESIVDIQAVVKQYFARNVDNPAYSDIEYICLIKNDIVASLSIAAVSDSNTIKIGTDYYNIKFIIPSRTYTQLLLSKQK